MSMTNQQGAPEALFYADALDRCAEVDFDHIFVPAAAVIRRLHAENERLAALVEAQQPAPSVAAEPEGGPPGSGGWEKHAIEMERQRDYYRQRCHTMEEHQNGSVWHWQGDDGDNLESMGNSMLVVIRADQLRALMQSSPTPQTDSAQDEFISREEWVERAMRVYLIAGDTEDEARECAEYQWGELDMDDIPDPYYAAMEDIEGRGPAPQADSQPAPVRDYPPLPVQVAWRDSVEHCDLYWRPVAQEHSDLEPLFTDTQMRAYVDADRAARAPADSVTAPAADHDALRCAVGNCMFNGEVKKHAANCANKRPTAQAADSVLEDAALSSEQQRAIFEAYESAASESYFEVRPQIDCNDRRRVFKAGYERGWDAARKQGANHD